MERLARGKAIAALCGPDFQEIGAGFSRWDQVFQRAWVLATPIMFFKMHLMNCSYFFKTLVGTKGTELPKNLGTRRSCRMKRWQVHGHEIIVLASQAGVKFAALAQCFVLLSVN